MSLMTLDKLSVFRGDCPVVDAVTLAPVSYTHLTLPTILLV